jgi:hypothetical protein
MSFSLETFTVTGTVDGSGREILTGPQFGLCMVSVAELGGYLIHEDTLGRELRKARRGVESSVVRR